MSTVGRSVGDTRRAEVYNPTSQVNPTTGLPSGSGSTSDGSQPITGGNQTSAASSTNPVPVAGVPFTYLGAAQLTLATTAGGAALPSVPATATIAIVQNNGTQGGRFRYDGSTVAPTATTGQRIAANGVVTMDVGQASLVATRVIADSGGVGGILDIVYGRYGS